MEKVKREMLGVVEAQSLPPMQDGFVTYLRIVPSCLPSY